MIRLHVIMACHNRWQLSQRAVQSALTAANFAGIAIDFTVFDDASSDGTADRLLELDADLIVLRGDGSAFWAKAMASAEAAVLSRENICVGTSCWIAWLNDDVTIDESAFKLAIDSGAFDEISQPASAGVAVGSLLAPGTGSISYGGLQKKGWHPLRFSSVNPSEALLPVDTFNGNLVFVPESTARRLGGIDGHFSHALADIDYGLRCQRYGIPVQLLPGTYGVCQRNSLEETGGIAEDWRRFTGTKGGGNLRSMVRILKKGSPFSWPLYVSATYLLWFLRNGVKASSRLLCGMGKASIK